MAIRDYNIAYDAIAEESNILNSKEFLDYKYRGTDDIMGSYCGNTELFTENILQIPIPDLETQEKLWITRSANN